MRIVITSYSYDPAVGGLETVSRLVAEGLRELGEEVTVITKTPSAVQQPFVLRNPSLWRVWRTLVACDVVLQSNISIKMLWVALIMRKPTMIVFHTWLTRPDGKVAWQDRLKRMLSRRVGYCYAVSQVLAEHVGPHCSVIPNPFNSALFSGGVVPSGETVGGGARLVFLGRLVSDKGCDLAIRALCEMRRSDRRATLTVIGQGPERDALQALAAELQLSDWCFFVGTLQGNELVAALRSHQVLLACSRWNEPFGLVALEALACNLVPVVPSAGGFPEAVGPFGVSYIDSAPEAIARAVKQALEIYRQPRDLAGIARHLAKHDPRRVAQLYRSALTSVSHHESSPLP